MAHKNYLTIFSIRLLPLFKIITLNCILYILDIISLPLKKEFQLGTLYFILVLMLLPYKVFRFNIVEYIVCFSFTIQVCILLGKLFPSLGI